MESNERVPIRQIIVEARLRLGLTQKQVAEACGITQSALSRFESGLVTSISRETLKRVHEVIISAAVEKAARESDSRAGRPMNMLELLAQKDPKNFLFDLGEELNRELAAKLKQKREDSRLVEEFANLQSKAQKFDGLESKVKQLEDRIVKLEELIRVKAKRGKSKRES